MKRTFRCLDVARAAGLEGERRSGREIAFRCSRHEDKRPSLKINDDKDIWMCGPCGGKGTAWQLAAFLSGRPPDDKPGVTAWLVAHGLLKRTNGHAGPNGRPSSSTQNPTEDATIVATYDYCDATGKLAYQSVRYYPKTFRRRRPDGRGGWIADLDGVFLVPYALERLVDRTPDVYLVEGERDAETLWAVKLPSSTNIGGSSQWHDTYAEQLHRLAGVERVFIIPDHDEPGHRWAAIVARSCHRVGIEPHIVTLIGLHDGAPTAAQGRDVSDWLPQHSVSALREQAQAAPAWQPQPMAMPSHWQRLDLHDLPRWQCPDLEPIVERLMVRRALVYIAAETQTGKTLFCQWLSWHCVIGGRLFDRLTITPVDRVGYLVLEDPARRIRDRFLDMQHEFPEPVAADRCVLYVAPGFTLTDEQFWTWLEQLIVTERRQLLFLDTYQRATPGLESFDDKAQGPILHRLADLTRRFDVTIAVIDHLRKQSAVGGRRRGEITFDDIKGSGGKAQNADAVILMARTIDRRQIRFQGYSKDYDEPIRVLLQVAPRGSSEPKFTYVGDLEQLANESRKRGDATRERVLAGMPSNEWISAPVLAKALGLAASTVLGHLKQLGLAERVEEMGDHRFRRYRRINDDEKTGKSSIPKNEG